MQPKIKTQKDFFVTECSIETPTDLNQLDEILRALKSTGKSVVTYNQGGVQGISVEQKTKISEAQAEEIRRILNIDEKIL